MVVFNYAGAEINAKVVYYGPALSGKTTNLEYIYEKMPAEVKGKMVSMKTRTDRTLFFDFLPLELGEINGYRTRMLLYTVPGQVYYNATRKLVLKGADAVVFVADSSPSKMAENLESLRNLEENLNEHGLTLDTLPWVIQYNKRDMPDATTVREMTRKLNLLGVPSFEAVATTGQGVYETFHGVARMLYVHLVDRIEKADVPPGPGKTAATQPQPHPQSRVSVAHGERQDESHLDDVVNTVLREVPDSVEPAAASAIHTETEQTQEPIDHVSPTDAGIRFAASEEGDVDSEVGRVIDFDRSNPAEPEAEPTSDEGFITDPFRGKGQRRPEPKSPQEASPGTLTKTRARSAPPTVNPITVSVPVVLTRSQVRKTIPIKLSLEIQVVDED